MYLTMRYITLKKEDIEALEYLYRKSPNRTIRKRSQCLILSYQRRRINDLASIFNVSCRTIEHWFDNLAKKGVDSLTIAEGGGAKTLLKDYSEEVIQQLELHNRNLKYVLTYFEENHNIKICKKTLQNFLKDTWI